MSKLHVYGSVGTAGWFRTMCGRDTHSEPSLRVVSINTAARLATRSKARDFEPCDECFKDPRVAMEILARVDNERQETIETQGIDTDHLLQLVRLGLL